MAVDLGMRHGCLRVRVIVCIYVKEGGCLRALKRAHDAMSTTNAPPGNAARLGAAVVALR